MDDFNFFFSFFGLLLGLSVAEMLSRLAEAIGERRRIGWLTSLLAVFVILDISGFWLWAWPNRTGLTVGWQTLYGGLLVAGSYYISATLVFPRTLVEMDTVDDHFWRNKRLVLAGLIFANLIVVGGTFLRHPPQLSDWILFLTQAAYWIPLFVLFFSRKRRLDLAMLGLLILQYIVAATEIVPSSNWGNSMGL